MKLDISLKESNLRCELPVGFEEEFLLEFFDAYELQEEIDEIDISDDPSNYLKKAIACFYLANNLELQCAPVEIDGVKWFAHYDEDDFLHLKIRADQAESDHVFYDLHWYFIKMAMMDKEYSANTLSDFCIKMEQLASDGE